MSDIVVTVPAAEITVETAGPPGPPGPPGPSGGLDQAVADGLYVNVAGDAMTGALSVLAPTLPGHPTTLAYVDARTPQITVSTTPPPAPAVGDLWVDIN